MDGSFLNKILIWRCYFYHIYQLDPTPVKDILNLKVISIASASWTHHVSSTSLFWRCYFYLVYLLDRTGVEDISLVKSCFETGCHGWHYFCSTLTCSLIGRGQLQFVCTHDWKAPVMSHCTTCLMVHVNVLSQVIRFVSVLNQVFCLFCFWWCLLCCFVWCETFL